MCGPGREVPEGNPLFRENKNLAICVDHAGLTSVRLSRFIRKQLRFFLWRQPSGQKGSGCALIIQVRGSDGACRIPGCSPHRRPGLIQATTALHQLAHERWGTHGRSQGHVLGVWIGVGTRAEGVTLEEGSCGKLPTRARCPGADVWHDMKGALASSQATKFHQQPLRSFDCPLQFVIFPHRDRARCSKGNSPAMGVGWRRFTESFKQHTPLGGSLSPTSNDRFAGPCNSRGSLQQGLSCGGIRSESALRRGTEIEAHAALPRPGAQGSCYAGGGRHL